MSIKDKECKVVRKILLHLMFVTQTDETNECIMKTEDGSETFGTAQKTTVTQ